MHMDNINKEGMKIKRSWLVVNMHKNKSFKLFEMSVYPNPKNFQKRY